MTNKNKTHWAVNISLNRFATLRTQLTHLDLFPQIHHKAVGARPLAFIRQRGFTILEALITIAIMSVAGLALTSLNVRGMKANKSALMRSDIMDTKRTITDLLSCEQTLGVARPTTCLGEVILKDKKGNPLLHNGKLGEWTIKGTCEVLGDSGAGLTIRATKPEGSNGTTFKTDPINNLPLDDNHPLSMLFSPDVRPCAGNFGNEAPTQTIPLGGIIMWSGSIAYIPSGWSLCDGSNGTPDLRDRFVVGSGGAYNVGDIGGSPDAVLVAHKHAPEILPTNGNSGFSIANPNGPNTGNFALTPVQFTSATNVWGQGYASQFTSTEGVSGKNANLPPYFSLAYIMKIK